MISKDYLTKKAYHLRDEELKSILFDSVSTLCRMISATTKDDAVNFLITTIVIPIIRKQYNDFSCNQLDSCFESAAYGYYGSYTKITGQLILSFLNQKRVEIFKEEEEKERNEARSKNEKPILACTNGGNAVLLGLYYHENGMKEYSFQKRLNWVNSNLNCPNTGKPVNEVIKTYLKKK